MWWMLGIEMKFFCTRLPLFAHGYENGEILNHILFRWGSSMSCHLQLPKTARSDECLYRVHPREIETAVVLPLYRAGFNKVKMRKKKQYSWISYIHFYVHFYSSLKYILSTLIILYIFFNSITYYKYLRNIRNIYRYFSWRNN